MDMAESDEAAQVPRAPEPSTELATVSPLALPSVIGPPSPGEWNAMQQQVEQLAKSGLVPKDLRGKPADIMVILLAGREVGVAPMMAMSRIHVIDGKPTMSAELMLALVLRAGHSLDILVTDATKCEVLATRRRAERGTRFSFTWEDAMRAGLPDSKLKYEWSGPSGNRRRGAAIPNTGVWYEHPAAMLRARAISAACRAVFPDVLMGISYVPEEMGADVDPVTGEVTPPSEPTIEEGQKVALRERIMALPDHLRESLRETMRERGWVLTRLPVRLLEPLGDEIAGLEAWVRKDGDPPAGDDATPVEGTVVPDSGEDEAHTDDEHEDAEVVPEPASAPETATQATASETEQTIRREHVQAIEGLCGEYSWPEDLIERIDAFDAVETPVPELATLLADMRRHATTVDALKS